MMNPLQWNTLKEAAALLAQATNREWNEREVVDACLRYYKPISHSEPRPSYLTGAPSKDTTFSYLEFVHVVGLDRKSVV